MAKEIKFNLIVDDNPVRNIGDLQNNFNVQDVIEVYREGLLERWLKVREYNDYLKKIKEISSEEDMKLAKKLVEIFNVETEEAEIEQSVYALRFLKEKKENLKLLKNKEDNWKEIIKEYHQDYEDLKKSLIEEKSNMPYIKEAVQEIYERYLGLFKLNYSDFYSDFMDKKCIFPILAILMNENLRDVFLEDKEISSEVFDDIMENIEFNAGKYYGSSIEEETGEFDNENITDERVYIMEVHNNGNELIINDEYEGEEVENRVLDGLKIKSDNYNNYITYVKAEDMIADINAIMENMRIFSGETDGYWKDIEPKGKKCMVISMEAGNYVRNAAEHREELDTNDINGNFLILDGIDYKSDSEEDKLIYMEV